MTVSISVNPEFKKLNDDPSYRIKQGGVGREREAIVDITVIAEDLSDAVIGDFIVDFTGTGVKFTQVYSCQVIESDDLTDLYQFTTGANSDASLGVISVKELTTGLANADATYTATLKAVIRGL